jgi:hypothetical protein
MAGHNVADMVKNANTAADHEALASTYDKEAAYETMAATERADAKSTK